MFSLWHKLSNVFPENLRVTGFCSIKTQLDSFLQCYKYAMKLILKIAIIFLVLYVNFAHAQRNTNLGVTGNLVRFYPEAQHLGSNLNNSIENKWGWSTGVFIQDGWKPKLKQIVEINFYKLSSDVFLQKNGVGEYGGGQVNNPIYGNYNGTPFNLLAISGGIKYLLNESLFIYPGIEIARALNKKVDINKTTYNVKLALGFNLRQFDVMIEYAYGLNYQRIVYDPTVPFASTHRNKFLQIKLQVPLFHMN